MSQPHPPIPEPQPHPDPRAAESDEPRTQSILLPPSERQGSESAEPAPPSAPPVDPASAPQVPGAADTAEPAHTGEPGRTAGPTPDWGSATAEPFSPEQPLPGQAVPSGPVTGQFAQPGHQPSPQPAYQPGHQPAYEPAASPQATGPLDFVPGFGAERPGTPGGSSAVTAPPRVPGPSTAPGTPSGSRPPGPRRSPLSADQRAGRGRTAVQRAGRGRTALVSVGLGVVALVLLEVGLALTYGNQSLWEVVPTWSAFATVAALLVLVPAVAGVTGRLPARTAWRVGAAGAAALITWWVLVALPLAASDRGFWLTAAVGAAGAALWLAPGRAE